MKLTPSSMARRRPAIAAPGSLGGPQIPSPVIRMAPKPSRLTVSSPPSETEPLAAADVLIASFFMLILQVHFLRCPLDALGLNPSWLTTQARAMQTVNAPEGH